jgi:hypothetical protein
MDALVARSHRCGFGGYSLLSTSLSPPPILLKYNLSAIRSLGLKTHSLFTWSRHRRALAAFRCAPLNNDILPQSQVAFIYHIQTFPTDRANYKPLFTLGKPTIDTTTRLEIGQKYIDSIQHGDPILYRRYIGKVAGENWVTTIRGDLVVRKSSVLGSFSRMIVNHSLVVWNCIFSVREACW